MEYTYRAIRLTEAHTGKTIKCRVSNTEFQEMVEELEKTDHINGTAYSSIIRISEEEYDTVD